MALGHSSDTRTGLAHGNGLCIALLTVTLRGVVRLLRIIRWLRVVGLLRVVRLLGMIRLLRVVRLRIATLLGILGLPVGGLIMQRQTRVSLGLSDRGRRRLRRLRHRRYGR